MTTYIIGAIFTLGMIIGSNIPISCTEKEYTEFEEFKYNFVAIAAWPLVMGGVIGMRYADLPCKDFK